MSITVGRTGRSLGATSPRTETGAGVTVGVSALGITFGDTILYSVVSRIRLVIAS